MSAVPKLRCATAFRTDQMTLALAMVAGLAQGMKLGVPVISLGIVSMMPEQCKVCFDKVQVMAFRGTGVCSEICRKYDKGEIDEAEWTRQRSDMAAYLGRSAVKLGLGERIVN